MADDIAAFLWLALIGWLLWWAFIGNPFSDEITVYRISCPVPFTEGGECYKKESLESRIVYKPLVERQEVIFAYIDDEDRQGPMKYSDCTVRDKKNWYCSLGVLREAQMIDGELISPGQDEYQYVSKIKWWLIKFGYNP